MGVTKQWTHLNALEAIFERELRDQGRRARMEWLIAKSEPAECAARPALIAQLYSWTEDEAHSSQNEVVLAAKSSTAWADPRTVSRSSLTRQGGSLP